MTATTRPIRKDSAVSGRFYQVDGEDYPSVTHILTAIAKPALITWAANTERAFVTEAAADLHNDPYLAATRLSREQYVKTLLARLGKVKAHQKELAKAGEIGTQTHKLIEWTMRTAIGAEAGPRPAVSDKALWAFMAFEDWAKSVNLKPLRIEQVVYSKTHGFAGTMDLLARVSGEITQCDFKTGKAVYPEAYLQSAAYQTALIEMGYLAPTAGLIVRLPKVETDPAFEVVTVPPREPLLEVFLAVKQLWAWTYKNDEAWRAKREARA